MGLSVRAEHHRQVFVDATNVFTIALAKVRLGTSPPEKSEPHLSERLIVLVSVLPG